METRNQGFEQSPLAHLNDVVDATLLDNRVPDAFSPEFADLSGADLVPETCRERRDLRKFPCFTIDGDDTKDMDDAVCLHKTETGYILGVHIADVAAYVTPGSALEAVAMARGTSIYMPHRTVPMLPSVLSDDLCSLNPGEDRNAISVFVELDADGNVRRRAIAKSLIRSRVKGVYSEVNAILNGRADRRLKAKYAGLTDMLLDMRELAEKLRKNREKNGANVSADTKSKFTVRDQKIVRIVEEKGASDAIVEEFMVLANRLVAEYFQEKKLPIVYRAQVEKGRLAKYMAAECGHAELALDRYAHFTSPIRRLADLKVHQVLTAHLNGVDASTLWEAFGEDLAISAERATRCENRSDQIYRTCDKICTGWFLTPLQNGEFAAEVVGHNYKNRPIFLLNDYRLRILGRAGLRANEGQKVSLKLAVDNQNDSVEVIDYKRVRSVA
jgi:ribonuclease R